MNNAIRIAAQQPELLFSEARLQAKAYRATLVELGVDRIAHLDTPLIDHLELVFGLLTRLQARRELCLAGLFHGAYGTEGLGAEAAFDLPACRRERVSSAIGAEAEALVFAFSVLCYQSLGRSLRTVLRGGETVNVRDRRDGTLLTDNPRIFEDLLRLKLADVIAHSPRIGSHSQFDMVAQHGAFWQVAAEYLGPIAVAIWNEYVGEQWWIGPTS